LHDFSELLSSFQVVWKLQIFLSAKSLVVFYILNIFIWWCNVSWKILMCIKQDNIELLHFHISTESFNSSNKSKVFWVMILLLMLVVGGKNFYLSSYYSSIILGGGVTLNHWLLVLYLPQETHGAKQLTCSYLTVCL
jgi:hypothetical protein